MTKTNSDLSREGAFYRKKLLLSMIIPGIFVFIMWLVKIIEVLFNIDLYQYGIYPLTAKGLEGIIFSPFIHANFNHLFSNTLPLFFISVGLLYLYY
jgi:membrane associated rhomboid family serine protease